MALASHYRLEVDKINISIICFSAVERDGKENMAFDCTNYVACNGRVVGQLCFVSSMTIVGCNPTAFKSSARRFGSYREIPVTADPLVFACSLFHQIEYSNIPPTCCSRDAERKGRRLSDASTNLLCTSSAHLALSKTPQVSFSSRLFRFQTKVLASIGLVYSFMISSFIYTTQHKQYHQLLCMFILLIPFDVTTYSTRYPNVLILRDPTTEREDSRRALKLGSICHLKSVASVTCNSRFCNYVFHLLVACLSAGTKVLDIFNSYYSASYGDSALICVIKSLLKETAI